MAFFVERDPFGPLPEETVYLSTVATENATASYANGDYALFSVAGETPETEIPLDYPIVFNEGDLLSDFMIEIRYDGSDGPRAIEAIILQDQIVNSITEGVVARLDNVSLLFDAPQSDSDHVIDDDGTDASDDDGQDSDNSTGLPVANIKLVRFDDRTIGEPQAGEFFDVFIEARWLDPASDTADDVRFVIIAESETWEQSTPGFRLDINPSVPNLQSRDYIFRLDDQFAGEQVSIRIETVEDGLFVNQPQPIVVQVAPPAVDDAGEDDEPIAPPDTDADLAEPDDDDDVVDDVVDDDLESDPPTLTLWARILADFAG